MMIKLLLGLLVSADRERMKRVEGAFKEIAAHLEKQANAALDR